MMWSPVRCFETPDASIAYPESGAHAPARNAEVGAAESILAKYRALAGFRPHSSAYFFLPLPLRAA